MNPKMLAASEHTLEDAAIAWLRFALEDEGIVGEDNFLAIGGHSLMAIELNTWLRESYGVQVDIAQLFQGTIRACIAGAA